MRFREEVHAICLLSMSVEVALPFRPRLALRLPPHCWSEVGRGVLIITEPLQAGKRLNDFVTVDEYSDFSEMSIGWTARG